ncbi:MAG: hypothetical protein RR983_11710 [Massilia sp.]|uniref:hypothetical protein n=1 Tax=Massilia sp. TaxID=1882437 RepID=UPI002FC97402
MKQTLMLLAAATVLLATTACNRSDPAPQPALNQDTICEVRAWDAEATAACQPGQKIAFLPNRFGNEQLPLLFVAVNCDLRYTVAMNNGGVVCIHARMRTEKAGAAEKEKAVAPAASS